MLKNYKHPLVAFVAIPILFVGLLMAALSAIGQDKSKMKYKELTPEEEAVIVNKATERPFTGRFLHNNDKGVYACKRCGAELFRSKDKFDSKSGWPSFDDAVKGAVKEIPDADGLRTEIVCAHCSAHLGHVFKGEGFTEKNTRHCVNSISLDFKPTDKAVFQTQTAIFAGGCFWGVEYYLSKAEGVIGTKVGYIGGSVSHPTYKQVCTGTTGHAEAIEVIFDPSKTNYETLAKLFFEIHDPTQKNRQGPDVGLQYRSAVFYLNEQQRQDALALIAQLRAKGLAVVTEVKPAGIFWPAEDYHQDYYDHSGGTPYCHMRVKRF